MRIPVVILTVAAAALVVVIGSLGSFAFYAPQPGQVATGKETRASGQLPERGIVEATVEDRMAPKKGDEPTLSDVTSFFGLEQDTIECSIIENNLIIVNEDDYERLASQPLAQGDRIILCLN